MNKVDQAYLTLTIPKKYRDILRTMAARRNLDNPDRVTSASEISKNIIVQYLERESTDKTSA
jgi:hypothetical protein